jgi:hypothetical protein
MRGRGGFIGTNVVPAATAPNSAASGLWTLRDQESLKRAGTWPIAFSESVLLHFDGTNGSTAFTDSSLNAVSFTAFGNAQISTSQSKFGGASGLFDGTGDYITAASNALFGFGTGDFTIEAWVRLSTLSDGCLFDNRTESNEGIGLYSAYLDAGLYRPSIADNTAIIGVISNYAQNPSITISSATWTHVAVSRKSGTVRLFVGGALSQTITDTRTYASASTAFIGTNYLATQGVNGNIDELRVVKGFAVYTAAFTPPAQPF